MKMVIVEIRGDTAVALREDGRFVTLRHQRHQVGETIQRTDFRTSHYFSRFIAACIAAVLLIGGQTALAVGMPYSYVTLDINPSIQYTLNIFDRVLSVSAVNQDAASVVTALEESGISFDKINHAIEQTVEQCRSAGYLSDAAQDYVVFSVASKSDNKVENLSDQLAHFSQVDHLISTEVVPTTIREIKEAGQKGTTPGKLALISRMQKQTGDTQGTEAWINRPVREIMLQISADNSNSQFSSTDQLPIRHRNQQSAQNSQNHAQSIQKVPQSSPGSRSFDGSYHSQTSSDTTGELSLSESAESQDDSQVSQDQSDSERVTNPDQSPQENVGLPDASNAAEAAIASLNEEDQKVLAPYITAYENAFDAEQAAIESGQSEDNLAACRQATASALAVLEKAAELNRIAFGTPIENSPRAGNPENNVPPQKNMSPQTGPSA